MLRSRLKHLLARYQVHLVQSFNREAQISSYGIQIQGSFRYSSIGINLFQRTSVSSLLQTYKKLSKAKLSAFVVLSTGAGFLLGSRDAIDGYHLGCTLIGTFGASACANTLNQIIEWRKDALMSRTRLRPLPSGKISRIHALAFAIVSGVTGLTLLAYSTNQTTTALAAGNILLYAGIYTPLKQVTYLNTWIGAIVGAIPPLIGWTSASKGSLEPGSWILAALLYFWQIPHFLSLAWTYRVDYCNAGYQMLSKFDATGKKTSICAFRNCIYLLPIGFLASHFKVTDSWFTYEFSLMTLLLALSASTFHQKATKQNSRSLFRASIYYLPLVLIAMVFHRQTNGNHHYQWATIKQELNTLLDMSNRKINNYGNETCALDSKLGRNSNIMQREADMFPLYAPFPFVPVPMKVEERRGIWDELDNAIKEVQCDFEDPA